MIIIKIKITLLLALFFFVANVSFAQDDECLTNLSIFHEYVKSKNFDAAYKPWSKVRKDCPDFNFAIYYDGEKILDDKIEKSTGTEKEAAIYDLVKLWDERLTYFPDKTNKGEYMAKGCQLIYTNKSELNKTDEELYSCFDEAYKIDKETFTNPQSLYAYFSLMVDLFDAKKKTDAELFNKYDDIVEKVEEEVENYSEKLNIIIEKENAGTALTSDEMKSKSSYENYLTNYDLISKGIDQKLGQRANCENLIPLYKRDFEQNKNDLVWVKRAAGKMSEKECTDDPLFFKLVNRLHELNPSANSAFYLGILKDKDGKPNEALAFYKQALDLETDNFKKAKLASNIGSKLKAKGNYSAARNYFRDALRYNPSNGRPYLSIAAMYAASANNCGDTSFNKRAVFWLAADEAKKAARVDPTLNRDAANTAENYESKAPNKADIFSCGCSGQVIKIGCWINSSVTVPKI